MTSGTFVYESGLKTDEVHVGDWDGDGNDEIAVARDQGGVRKFFLDCGDGRQAERSFVFRPSTETVAIGDWDGSGRDFVGTVADEGGPLRWRLDTNDDGALAEIIFRFGSSGETPIVGDWNGDGIADAGVIRDNGGVYQRLLDFNTPTTRGGAAEASFSFGVAATDTLFVCDWDGDGADEPGVARKVAEQMRFIITEDLSNVVWKNVQFGKASYTPLAADFDGK